MVPDGQIQKTDEPWLNGGTNTGLIPQLQNIRPTCGRLSRGVFTGERSLITAVLQVKPIACIASKPAPTVALSDNNTDPWEPGLPAMASPPVEHFGKKRSISPMILEQLKALGNDTRMQMMEWLKDPLRNFPPQDHGDPAIGVCVTHLQHKAGLSPSTASAHLAILQRAGFVLTTRIGKWTYYRRNEQAIDDFAARLKIEL